MVRPLRRALHRLQEAGDALEQARFAAARRPQQDEAVAAIDRKIDTIGGGDEMLLGLVLQGDALDLQQRRDRRRQRR
jgi:hypothetical protein